MNFISHLKKRHAKRINILRTDFFKVIAIKWESAQKEGLFSILYENYLSKIRMECLRGIYLLTLLLIRE